MKKIAFIVLLIACLSVTTGSAQKNDSLSVDLTEVQVKANQKKLYSEMGRIVTVIDKSEIKKAAVQSLDQLLDYVSGIDVRQRGVNTTQADISMRGGTFDQVLILLNGVNVTDPQTGHFNIDIPVNLSDISRIEVLQGSAARVLGPNAFSGAINIVTEPSNQPSMKAELNGGSYSTFGQSLSTSFGTRGVKTIASVNHRKSDGYLTNTDFEFTNAFLQSSFATKGMGKFDLQLASQFKDFGANGFYSLKYPNQREETKTFLTTLDWNHHIGNLSLNAQGSWRRHHDRYELDHAAPAGYKYHLTDIVGGKLNASYTSVVGKTTAGLNLRNEHVFSNSLGIQMSNPDSMAVPFEKNVYFKKKYNRTIYSGMIDHSVRFGNWFMSVGVASSYCSDFDFTTYGGFDLSYSINDNEKIYLSANSASRLPTFTDLFFSNPVQQGTLTLKPEQSQTLELGLKINKKNWNLISSIFYRNGKNVIDWVKMNSTDAKYIAMNLSDVDAFGGDLSMDYQFHGHFLKKMSLAYSYLNMDKKAVGFDSKYALDYLKNKVVVSLDHQLLGRLSARWNLGYYDRSGNYDANTNVAIKTPVMEEYKPYLMLDSKLLWSLKKVDVFLDLNNILNTTYADYGGLNQPGFNYHLGVRLKL